MAWVLSTIFVKNAISTWIGRQVQLIRLKFARIVEQTNQSKKTNLY